MTNPKHTSLLSRLLAMLLLASSALAQTTADWQTETKNETPGAGAISAARSPYTNHGDADAISQPGDDPMLAQFPRHASPPSRAHHPHASPNYRTPWMDRGNGHALIGAAIGFGFGAAIGAKANSDSHAGATAAAVLIFGGVGALIGAAIGANHGGPNPFAHHRKPSRPSRDGESDVDADSGGSRFDNAPAAPTPSASAAGLLKPVNQMISSLFSFQ